MVGRIVGGFCVYVYLGVTQSFITIYYTITLCDYCCYFRILFLAFCWFNASAISFFAALKFAFKGMKRVLPTR